MTRRDLLKSSVAAVVPGTIPGVAAAYQVGQAAAAVSQRERLLLDFGWRFHLGHANDPSQDFSFGAHGAIFAKMGGFATPGTPTFDDSAWQKVDLPHDWAVDLPFENAGPLVQYGSKPLGRAYPATSIGWYRRAFDVPAADAGRRFVIDFDGVFRNATVIFNGHYIGENVSGYVPFHFDVTDFVTFGAKNVLLLRVDATENEGWFYEGAGIYRHVWLTKTNSVHVGHWGTFVRSEIAAGSATVSITTEVNNDGDGDKPCRIVSRVIDADGRPVATTQSAVATVAAWASLPFEQKVTVPHPSLWSIEEPHMYRLVTEVQTGGVITDRYETPFGIRGVRFDADKGFFLNGKHVRIAGTCNHQDHAGVGAALPDRIQYYRIEKLKEMGGNAYRTSHNPATPELLEACDKLGMVVMGETRMMSSNPEGLSQLERMIRRDRNHPSVVIWSLGNEEREQASERGGKIMTTMKRLANRLDPTRLVANAMDSGWGKGASLVVDVQGFNYRDLLIDNFHKQFPQKPILGTETASALSTRGIYANDRPKGYVSAYDVNKPFWGSLAEDWMKVYAEREFIGGGFVWTGFDYRGEPTPYGWPCISSHFGIMDTCGFPKDTYYYYQAWWGSKPVLHLFPHWNWPDKEGQEVEVWCHSNLDRVELFLNGQSLGSQEMPRNSHLAWKVKYAPGMIEARGFKGGQQVLTSKRETAGAPAKIVLRPDRMKISADGEDVSMIVVEVVDAQGRTAPVADNEIAFQVSGGRLIGVGNGDPSSHEADHASKRRAFNGLCMAIVQSGKEAGELKMEASAAGLQGASATISCESVKLRPAVP